MRWTLWLLFVITVVLFGCSRSYVARYDIGLVDARRPIDSEQQYGKEILRIATEGDSRVSYFEDGLVSIVWRPEPSGIAFELTNRLDQAIEVDWEASAYVDEEGKSHRIVQSSVEPARIEQRQPPTSIAPRATLVEAVRSADNVLYEPGIHDRSREMPLFPVVDNNGLRLTRAAEERVGKRIELVLAFRVGGGSKAYRFVFAIEGVEVDEKTGAEDS